MVSFGSFYIFKSFLVVVVAVDTQLFSLDKGHIKIFALDAGNIPGVTCTKVHSTGTIIHYNNILIFVPTTKIYYNKKQKN